MLTITIIVVAIAVLIAVFVFGLVLPAWLTALPVRIFAYLQARLGTVNAWLVIALTTLIVMMADSVLTGWVWLTGLVFIVGLSLTWITWLRLKSLMRRLLGVSQAAAFNVLRIMIALMAFTGFIGIVFPDFISWGLLAGAILVGFIFSVSLKKTNIVDKAIIPVTIFIVVILSWQYAAPDGFRSSTRYVASWSKVFNTTKDRASIGNETEAATTYAIALKDISVLYTISEKKGVSFVDSLVVKEIAKGDTLRLWSHKDEVLIVDGQGLLQIQIRNTKGTFINGDKFWVEAEFVEIVSPREIMANAKAKAKAKNLSPRSEEVKVIKPDYFMLEGREVFPLKAGEETPWFGCLGQFKIFSPTFDYVIKVSDGTEYAGGKDTAIPDKEGCYFKVVAKSDQVVTAVKV